MTTRAKLALGAGYDIARDLHRQYSAQKGGV
jgi:hypothetical protein